MMQDVKDSYIRCFMESSKLQEGPAQAASSSNCPFFCLTHILSANYFHKLQYNYQFTLNWKILWYIYISFFQFSFQLKKSLYEHMWDQSKDTNESVIRYFVRMLKFSIKVLNVWYHHIQNIQQHMKIQRQSQVWQ